jgi:hypothetical protein
MTNRTVGVTGIGHYLVSEAGRIVLANVVLNKVYNG